MPPVPDNTARATKRYKLILTDDQNVVTEYQGHTQKIELPVPQQQVTRFGNGNAIAETSPDQLVNITLAQDSENPASLWRLMRENAGKKAQLIVYPHYDGTYAEQVTINLVKPPLIADVTTGTPILHTVACPCDGEPEPYVETAPAPVDPEI